MVQENGDIDVEMGITLKRLTQQLAQAESRMNKTARRSETYFKKLSESGVNSVGAVDRKTADLDRRFGRLDTRIGGVSRSLVTGLATAGVASLTGLGFAATRAVRDIAAIGDEAGRAGVSVERLQELKFIGDQNRIPLDAMVDGLKELQLRADEFIQTGKGPAQEAFKRMGYGADELAQRLEDPTELFLDLIGRMEDFDQAAQIRIADEVFGAAAGERFTQLLSRGEQGLRDLAAEANELGTVLDAETVQKAQELDAKFAEVQTRLTTMWQSGVVGAAEFFGLVGREAAEVQEILDDIRGAVPGVGDLSEGDLEDSISGLRDLRGTIVDVESVGRELQQSLRDMSIAAGAAGLSDLSTDLSFLSDETKRYNDQLRSGEITLQDYAKRLADVQGDAEETAAEMVDLADDADGVTAALEDIDAVSFSTLLSGLSSIGTRLNGLRILANQTIAAMGEAEEKVYTEDGHFFDQPGADNLVNPPTGSAPTSSPRPRPAPNNIDFGVVPPASGSGGRSPSARSGGRSRRDEVRELLDQGDRELSQMQQRIDLLGKTAAEQARLEFTYEALQDAKRNGIQLDQIVAGTSETVREAIERQADGVYRLASDYEAAKIDQSAFESGLRSMSDELAAVIVQGQSLGDVLSNAFLQAGQSFLASGLQDIGNILASGGGTGSAIFRGLAGVFGGSFEGGGYTGSGPRTGGVDGRGGMLSILHPNETVIDHTRSSGAASSGPVQVEIYVKDDGRIGAIARREGGAAARAAVVTVREEVPQIMQDFEKRMG